MASEKIKFEIGSVFFGEGFDKANSALKTAGKETANASKGLGAVLTEAKNADGALGKMASTADDVVKGFAAMGVAGAAIASIKVIAQEIIDHFNQLAEEGERAIKEWNDGIERAKAAKFEALLKDVRAELEGVRNQAMAAVGEFDRMVAAAQKLKDIADATSAATSGGGIADIQAQKLAAMAEAQSEQMKKLVEAEYDLEIVERKMADLQNANVEKRSNAETAYMNAVTSRNNAERALAAAVEAVATAEEVYAEAEKKHATNIAQFEAARKAAHDQVVAAQTKLAEKEDALAQASARRELVSAEAETAEKNMANALVAAQQKYDALAASAEASAKIEENIFATEEQRAEMLRRYTDAIKSGASQVEALAQIDTVLEDERRKALEIERLQQLTSRSLTDVTKAYAEALEEGFKGQEAYNAAVAKLSQSAESAASGSAVGGVGGIKEAVKEGVRDGMSGVNFNLSTTSTLGMANEVEHTFTFRDYKRQVREAERQQRNHENLMRTNTRETVQYLKGEMPEKEARLFKQWVITQSKGDWKTIYESALHAQLLSKSEQERQLRACEEIERLITEKLGLK